jgi:hypothetical protein
MTETVFSGFGVEIVKRDGRYFARYDDGDIVAHLREDEISEEEVAKAQKSERDAYEVLLACQLRAAPPK